MWSTPEGKPTEHAAEDAHLPRPCLHHEDVAIRRHSHHTRQDQAIGKESHGEDVEEALRIC
jgi:hypothetical protein